MQIKNKHRNRDLSRGVHRSGLTGEQVFRLWRAAVKDDGYLANDVIRKVYDDMIAFDSDRAEDVVELVIRRNKAARHEFRALLRDMQMSNGPNHPEQSAVGRRLDS
jgi:hypothetical protein